MTSLLIMVAFATTTFAAEDAPYGRGFNFGPGPAALPVEVLERVSKSLLNFRDTGIGIMEYTNLDSSSGTHPGVPATPLQEMILDTENKLRSSISIPDNYDVLFMHGGAVGHFSGIPMNFLGGDGSCADYLDQGFWSMKSFTEAQKYGDVKMTSSFKGGGPPQWTEWAAKVRPCAAYVHAVMLETVQGFEMLTDPSVANGWTGPPVVVDATSTLLSRPIDVSAYGMIYASGGKNLPHGVTAVIIRREFLDSTKHMSIVPSICDYRSAAGAIRPIASQFESRPNTPPIWGIYLLNEVLDHLQQQGGVAAQVAAQEQRALKLYGAIDGSKGFYINNIHADVRSRMNVVFNLQSKELETLFISEAGLLVKPLPFVFGHPSSGGARVTTYNWITDESIDHVYAFMIDFEKKHSSSASADL